MGEINESKNYKNEEKNKIRNRYSKTVNFENLEVIPAHEKQDILYDDSPKRVAVYVRVSTDDPRQTSSYELQKSYYTDVVTQKDNWTLVDVYADEGKSGTTLKHRDGFLRMIEDCKQGKIDLIVTKSVSRFARNIEDCIHYVRMLRRMNPPIGVYFETDGIYSIDIDVESRLTFSSYVAQEESSIKSKSMDRSVDMRFSRGILLTPVLLGYDLDEDGTLTINEEEAKTVRLIFFLYLYGFSCQQIAEKLEELGRKTKLNNQKWSSSTVRAVLTNERHCGDVLARKTFTPDFLTHQHKKNTGQKSQYMWRNDHDPIISRDDFIAVQHMLQNAKYASKYSDKSFLPELKAISEGILKGFVLVHPTWAGFGVEDYLKASKKVNATDEADNSSVRNGTIEYSATKGEFDLRGFEVVRSQFYDINNKISATFFKDGFVFSTTAIRKLQPSEYIEMLINPFTKEMAIRLASNQNNKYALRWASKKAEIYYPRKMAGTPFLKTLFDVFNWTEGCKYKVNGVVHSNGDGSIITFDMRETEVFIPYSTMTEEEQKELMDSIGSTRKDVKAYPQEWIENFGDEYYTQVKCQPLSDITEDDWTVEEKTEQYSVFEGLNVTSKDKLAENIDNLISEISSNEDAPV